MDRKYLMNSILIYFKTFRHLGLRPG